MIEQLGDRVGLGGRLQQRLGPDAGKIVILHSDQLDAAQKGVRVIRALSIFLALAMLALFALAVFLAKGRRRETLRNVGTSFIVVGVLLLVVRKLAGNWIVDTLTNSQVDEEPPATDLADRHGSSGRHRLDGDHLRRARDGVGHPRRPDTRRDMGRSHLAPTMRDARGGVLGDRPRLPARDPLGADAGLSQALWILIFGGLIALGTEAFRRLTVREFPAGAARRLSGPMTGRFSSRLERSIARAVGRRRIFPYLAAMTFVLALGSGAARRR